MDSIARKGGLKTALELLGDDGEEILDGTLCTKGEERAECATCKKSLLAFELVARRAREEAFELAAQWVCSVLDDNSSRTWFLRDGIRALPTEPTCDSGLCSYGKCAHQRREPTK